MGYKTGVVGFVCFWDSTWNSIGRSPKFTFGIVLGSPPAISHRSDPRTCSKSLNRIFFLLRLLLDYRWGASICDNPNSRTGTEYRGGRSPSAKRLTGAALTSAQSSSRRRTASNDITQILYVLWKQAERRDGILHELRLGCKSGCAGTRCVVGVPERSLPYADRRRWKVGTKR